MRLNYNKLYIVVFLCTTVFRLYAQDFNTKQYLTENGLPSNLVYDVVQDSDKFLWFSTEIGVSRFDGKNFKNYDFDDNLPDNVIYEVKETNRGKWFMSGNGKLAYITPSYAIKGIPKLDATAFLSELIETPSGTIVLASFGDGLRIQDKENTYHLNKTNGLIDDYVSFVWSENEDFFALSSMGISKIKKDRSVETVWKFENSIHFSRACRLSNNKILFSGKDKIYLFSSTGNLIEIKNSSALTQYQINQISLLKGGQLAACTNHGVLFFDLINDSIAVSREIMPAVLATNIIMDHEDNYWISTLGAGVFCFKENKFHQIGLPQKSYCFYQDITDTSIYIGYENSELAKWKEGTIEDIKIDKKNEYSSQKIRSIQKEKDELWLVLDGSIASYKDGTTKFYRTGAGVIEFDGDNVLIGNRSGYWKIKKQFLLDSLLIESGKPKNLLLPKDRFLNIRTNAIQKYKEGYLVATDIGLYVDNGKQLSQTNHHKLSKARIKSIFVQEETIAISTFGYGVFLISNKDTINFNNNNGLTSDFCNVAYIYNNQLFIGTDKGLNIITDYKQPQHKISSITKQDGLSNEAIQDIIIQNDNILLATLGGVFGFQLNALPQINYEIPLFLEELKVNEIAVNYIKKEQFSYNENRFSFQFTTISFNGSDRVRMFYQLGDKDDNWKEFKGNYLEFNSLKSQNYSLRVKAMINKESSKIFTYSFIINPPFWKTYWFIASVILSVILLIYWFFKVRVLTYNRDVVRELITLFINKLKKEEFILVKNVTDGSLTRIVLNNLLYIKGAGNYIELYFSTSEKILARTTMKEIFEEVNASPKQEFVRCHKSYIVNVKNITAVHGDFVKIKDEKIPIGKQYLDSISAKVSLLQKSL